MLRILICGFLIWVTAASAAVFQWRDNSGQSHFSDRPVPGAEAVVLRRESAYYRVEHVYDGDTVRLEDGRKVRLLNINAPEIETERKRGEPGGEEARRRMLALVAGRRVRLEYDVQRHDKYGRTLAHLFTANGLHVNLILVQEGLAVANIHPPNLRYADRLVNAQTEARRRGRGIWGMPHYAPSPMGTLRRRRLHGWQRLTGVPRAVREGRKYARLLFAADLSVVVPRGNLIWFPPLRSYLGHPLEVRGWPSRRGHSHSILVRHPSALVVLDQGQEE